MAIIKDIERLKMIPKEACKAFLKECSKAGLDVVITETLRSKERQYELYGKGRNTNTLSAKGVPTKYADPKSAIVTSTLNSKHIDGVAWDITFKSTGYSDTAKFKKAGAIGIKLGITWGGSWKTFKDLPHFQYTSGSFEYKEKEPTAEMIYVVDKLFEAELLTNKDIWLDYLVGNEKLKASNLKSLFVKILTHFNILCPSCDVTQIIKYSYNLGIITNKDLWTKYLDGTVEINSEFLLAFLNKVDRNIK